MKRIRIIKSNGAQVILPDVPTTAQIAHAVGGRPELVKVVDRIDHGRAVFSCMFVHEFGLIENQRRNEKATEIYQRNVRMQFGDQPHPFRAADAAYLAQFGRKEFDHDLTPAHAVAKGYKDDPWIAGDVVMFDGYSSISEVEDAVTAANKRKE